MANNKVLITGAAGFIGSALVLRLLDRGDAVVGIDNHNDYYDPALKEARVARHLRRSGYTHLRVDIMDRRAVGEAFRVHKPNKVVHLAALAGVRDSIERPIPYIECNILGFTHVLEESRLSGVEHFVYAGSSSVYGANTLLPNAESHNADRPLNVYAAAKKSNELIAHCYGHVHRLPTTGLRFFTVYGPWGRPDMALYGFADAMIAGKSIKVYNFGEHERDFVYVDDVVEAVARVIDLPPGDENGEGSDIAGSGDLPWRILNIGSGKVTALMEFIAALEKELNITAKKEMLPAVPGDMRATLADIDELVALVGYRPKIDVQEGVRRFVSWYLGYRSLKKVR